MTANTRLNLAASRSPWRRGGGNNNNNNKQQRSSKTFHTVIALSLSAVAWYNIYSNGPVDSLGGGGSSRRRRRIQNGNRRQTLFAATRRHDEGHRRASAASFVVESGIVEKTEMPTYLQLCRHLVDASSSEEVVMEETEETCTSPFWHSSLVGMFTSQLIAETAQANDIQLHYRHDCPRFFSKLPQEESTIQMVLPSPLIPASEDNKGSLQDLKAACGRCLQPQSNSRPEQCFFTSPQHFAQIVPTIRTNLRMAVGAVDDFLSAIMIPGMTSPSTATAASPVAEAEAEEEEEVTEVMEEEEKKKEEEEAMQEESAETSNNDDQEGDQPPRRRLAAPIPSSSSRRTASSMWNRVFGGTSNDARKLLATDNSDAPSHDGEDNAVVYLDLDHHGQLHAIPHHVLATHLPRTITNLYVILSPACRSRPRFRAACLSYGRNVQTYLAGLLPRAQVTFDFDPHSTFSTREIVSDFIHAESILCTAGSLGCILPAVSRRRVGADGQALDTVVVQNDELYPWLMMLPTQYTSHMTILPPTTSAPVQVLETPAAEADADEKEKKKEDVLQEASRHFLVQSPTDRSICPLVRGRKGRWVQDWDFAPQLQYKTPLQHYLGFADRAFTPKPNLPYRRPTSYKWVEDESASSCDIDITSLESFCQTMKAHNLQRIFYVGDYTQMNMAFSLWKVLGHEDNPVDREQTDPNFDREIQCEDGTQLTLSFARNDKMEENDKEVDMTASKKNCGSTYCYPWTERYTSYGPGPTLLVVNFGSHFYSEDDFDAAMTRFTTALEAMHRPQDAVFFRTNSPGHLDCQRGRVKGPFDDFEEYRPTVTWKFSWDLYDGYNDMAIRKSREYNERVGDTAAQLQVVDVYPMTVLRQDGHMSGQDCQDCGIANDCINYALPGPTDWWNHLLFTNLQDMAVAAAPAVATTASADAN